MEYFNQLPEPVLTAMVIGTIIIIGLIGAAVALKAVDYTGQRLRLPPLILHPLRTVVRAMILVVVLTLVAAQFGIELMSIVTAAVAMIAIGFIAVWSILSNITATLFLVILKPFNVHDQIEFAGEEVSGEVVDVNMFYTTLLDTDGRRVQIPNNHFFQKILRVQAAAKTRAISLDEQLSHG